MEIKLTAVALASLRELEEDYRDFLRTRHLPVWDAGHPKRRWLSELNRERGAHYEAFRAAIEGEDPEISANVLLGLTAVTCFLLKRQIQALEKDFVKNGGLRERMSQARVEWRRRRGETGGT
jgi:four helix bundle suffix protein